MATRQSLLCSLGLFASIILMAGVSARAEDLPLPAGVEEAEAEKSWDKAIELYKAEIATYPMRDDLWEHISEVESERDQPAKAEAAMDEALKIKPNNVAYLLKHAQLAEWAGDNTGAERSYSALVKLSPLDDKNRLELAKVLSWEGKTKESIVVLQTYVTWYPKDKEGLLLLSQLYMWNNDLDKSAKMIERYRQVAGEDKEYKKVKMQLLANANRNIATAVAADDLLQAAPNDCDAYTAKVTALGALRRFKEMIESLAGADKYCTDKTAEALLDRKLLTATRSYVRGEFTYSTDSETVRIGTLTADARYKVDPNTYLLTGASTGWLSASTTSGLATASGQSRIEQSSAWIGAEKAVDAVWLTGRLGYHEAGYNLQTTAIAHGGVEYRPSDLLTLGYDVNHDFYSVSPLAVSKGIKLTDNQLLASLHLGRTTLDTKTNYGFLSDSNSYWTVLVAPHYNVINGKKWNADLGVSAQVTSFAHTPTDGYYDPTRFRQFLVTSDISYAFDNDNKIGLTASTGVDKDSTMTGYRRADNIAVEGNFGLYEDWMLNMHAGHSDSIGINSQQYHVEDYTANVTRRF